jgi:hypothetical protein
MRCAQSRYDVAETGPHSHRAEVRDRHRRYLGGSNQPRLDTDCGRLLTSRPKHNVRQSPASAELLLYP